MDQLFFYLTVYRDKSRVNPYHCYSAGLRIFMLPLSEEKNV